MDNLDVFSRISSLLENNRIVLFMKGSKLFPQCGFSGLVVSVLNFYSADFYYCDVLKDEKIRQGIKDYTEKYFMYWPTIPQLYVNKKFIGGADIVKDAHENGQFKDMIT